MLALRLHRPSSLSLEDIPVPEMGPAEALVRVRRAGICNTDLELVKGYLGYQGTLGHEMVGVVERCSDPRWVGQRVCSEINLSCGHCRWCKQGLGLHCPSRRVLGIDGKDGCFAEYVTVPISCLHAVPDELSDELAVFTEPLAAAFEITEQVAVSVAERIAVLGDGKLGLLCAMALKSVGAEPFLGGSHARKLLLAEEAGIEAKLSSDLRGPFDVVVDATGRREGLEQALGLLRPRGTLVLKSTYHGRPEVDMAQVVINEITIVGSRCGPFDRALKAMAEGVVDPEPLIDQTLPLSEGLEALRQAEEPGALKILLAP